jgi:probable HAF family extracellular repeat protein
MASAVRAAGMYHVTDLGSYRTQQLNNAGQVVGTYNPKDRPLWNGVQPPQAFRYNSYGPHAGRIEDIGDTYSFGWAINDSGVVAGTQGQGNDGPFVSDGVTTTSLHPSPNPILGSVSSINTRGEIVGSGFTKPDGTASGQAVYRDGQVIPLALPGGGAIFGQAINDAGQVTGWAGGSDRTNHGVIWSDNGQVVDMGNLGGRWMQPRAINNTDMVVGAGATAAGLGHGFVWQNGTLRDVGTLGGDQSALLGVNNLGEAVGYSWLTGKTSQTDWPDAVRVEGGKLIDLNDEIAKGLGLRLLQAIDVNDLGQILVQAIDTRGFPHNVLLTPEGQPIPADPIPAPEPTAFAVLAIGLSGLALLRRRRGSVCRGA